MNDISRRHSVLLLLLLVPLGGGLAAPGWAQAPVPLAAAAPEEAEEAEEPEEPEVAPDSPRASVQTYLHEAENGEWERAARYLAVPEGRGDEGPFLARRLKAVLDTHVWFDLEELSAASVGDLQDGLSRGVELVARIPVGEDSTQPVYMVRRSDDGGPLWAFSPNTVRRTDGWYDQLPDRWIRDWLIEKGLERLLRVGWLGLLWWQWIALPLLTLLAWGLGRVLGAATWFALRLVSSRARHDEDDSLRQRVGPPLSTAWGLAIFSVALPSLSLTAKTEGLLRSAVTAGVVLVVFWVLWRSVDTTQRRLLASPSSAGNPSARNLVQVGGRLARGTILFVAFLAVLSIFGYPVTTLLAGVGIGGLALAFGAQKTVENLFGSMSLAADHPFRVGDFVKVQDFTGTVEEMGLRSTRFRTMDRTIITIPNGSLADQRLETYSARDRLRLNTVIGLEYHTTFAQMQEVLAGFKRVLREHPRIWPGSVIVRFNEFGSSSLDIMVMAWFEVPSWEDFLQCREEVLLGFMGVVEDAGTRFAFPTRTVHLSSEGRPGAKRAPSPQSTAEA